MSYKRVADTIHWLHWGTASVLLFGVVFQFLFWWWIPIYFVYWLLSLSISGFMKECPLTRWERTLRAKYDPDGYYSGSFLAHYLEKYFSIRAPQYVISLPFALSLVISSVLWVHWFTAILR